MAGQFILWNISVADKDQFLRCYPGSEWSPLQHMDKGWTEETRAVLENVKNNVAIANRDNLPPHRYLIIKPASPAPTPDSPVKQADAETPDPKESVASPNKLTEAQRECIFAADWTLELIRPADPNVGLKALGEEAAKLFSEGRLREAIIAQIEKNGASIEIYYLGKVEME